MLGGGSLSQKQILLSLINRKQVLAKSKLINKN